MSSTKEIPKSKCECEIEDMSPERISFEKEFTHRCLNCQGGVTYQMNDSYNHFYGYSGYDEHPRDDVIGEDEDEAADTY